MISNVSDSNQVPIATTFYNKVRRNVALKMMVNSTVDEMAFTTSNRFPERGGAGWTKILYFRFF
jgi:hypothetical protein